MAPPRHGSFRLLVVCSLTLLLCRAAGAVEYVVGDDDFGWDSGINYATWAPKHTFAVGDVLVFQYVKSQHNVYEVTESTYRSCDAAAGDNGVRAKYTSGYDKVVLAEPRSYWFICEFPGHCLGGMKVNVNVSAAAAPAPSSPNPNVASSSLAGGSRRGWLTMGLALGVLELMINWAIVGLDGIRMLDPNTSRTLRIYSLESVTRWDVLDSSIFAFWSKSSVDAEARRIRLKSNSYTTNTILDTVTAATVQFKEMGASSISRSRVVADAVKPAEQQAERKKNFLDWRNLMKPMNEEKDHWVPDEAVSKCTACAADFSAFNRRHHCRNCGDIFCDKCTQARTPLTSDADAQPVRVCDRCMFEVSERLNIASAAAQRPVVHSHEDLAKKLQEAMDINKRSSSGTRSSGGSDKRIREVACPICTVHLQVPVPTSGSETIECGVCQHPFLVSAR